MPDAPARLARVRDATHSTLAQAAVDVYCDPSAGHDRARAVDILASTLVGDDPVRMAALTADRLDAVADEQGIEALGGELGPALWLVTAETTPVACVARLRAHIEAAYVHVCDTDSLRQFRDVSPECLHLGAAHCAIAEHDADALAGRGEHAGALAIYELLAFSPPRGCASSRELGYRAARAAEAAGDPVRARELVQRTHDLHGYPAIKAGSPYDRGPWRIRSRPSPATVP